MWWLIRILFLAAAIAAALVGPYLADSIWPRIPDRYETLICSVSAELGRDRGTILVDQPMAATEGVYTVRLASSHRRISRTLFLRCDTLRAEVIPLGGDGAAITYPVNSKHDRALDAIGAAVAAELNEPDWSDAVMHPGEPELRWYFCDLLITLPMLLAASFLYWRAESLRSRRHTAEYHRGHWPAATSVNTRK